MDLNLTTDYPTLEFSNDGYWWIRFDINHHAKNIEGNSSVRIKVFEGDLKDFRIKMETRKFNLTICEILLI